MTQSAILYKNAANTVFLIDIPTSIALAQELSPAQTASVETSTDTGTEKNALRNASTDTDTDTDTRRDKSKAQQQQQKQILSSTPLNEPYVLSTEPKTDVARARVLERIPAMEQVYHADVVGPVVCRGLSEIRTHFFNGDGEWCLPRRVVTEREGFGGEDVCSGEKRKRIRVSTTSTSQLSPAHSHPTIDGGGGGSQGGEGEDAPVILAPGINIFPSLTEIRNLSVRNTSTETATIQVTHAHAHTRSGDHQPGHHHASFHTPPLSNFLLCNIPESQSWDTRSSPSPEHSSIPGLSPEKKFNLILLDPPWHNKSVRRSRQYRTQSYREDDGLMQRIAAVLRTHLQQHQQLHVHSPSSYAHATTAATATPAIREKKMKSLAAIWITNSAKTRTIADEAMRAAGLRICEEWIWVKTTTAGEPITAVDGLWRKPYEILLIGMEDTGYGYPGTVTRRVIAAVPDVHSRKPNLREVFERVFFSPLEGEEEGMYTALEVFARNLTAGWWAVGDEVLKFNEDVWWYQDG